MLYGNDVWLVRESREFAESVRTKRRQAYVRASRATRRPGESRTEQKEEAVRSAGTGPAVIKMAIMPGQL